MLVIFIMGVFSKSMIGNSIIDLDKKNTITSESKESFLAKIAGFFDKSDGDMEFITDLGTLNLKLATSKANLVSCQDSNGKLSDELKSKKSEMNKNKDNYYSLKIALNSSNLKSEQEQKDLNKKIINLQKDCNDKLDKQKDKLESNCDGYKDKYEDLKYTYDKLKSENDKLIKNSAYVICCKKRVEDSSIKYYDVRNGVVYCSKDEGSKLSC